MNNGKAPPGRNEGPRFVRVIYPLFDSPAFKELSGGAVQTLLLLIRKHNGTNNGEIPLSCRQVACYFSMGKGTASKKFDELILHGFIAVSRKGRFTTRHATTWRLTFERTMGNNSVTRDLATNEWKRYCSKQKKVPDIEL